MKGAITEITLEPSIPVATQKARMMEGWNGKRRNDGIMERWKNARNPKRRNLGTTENPPKF